MLPPENTVSRNICRDFMNGHCRFGEKCKFTHVEIPYYIFSSEDMDIHPDELRIAILPEIASGAIGKPGSSAESADNAWLNNYFELCKTYGTYFSPELVVDPFDKARVYAEVEKMKVENPLRTNRSGYVSKFHNNYRNYSQGGERNYGNDRNYDNDRNYGNDRNYHDGNRNFDNQRAPYNDGNRPPYNDRNRSQYNDNRPPYNDNRPPYNDNRPPYNDNRPPYNDNRPSYQGNSRPPYHNNNRNYQQTNSQPFDKRPPYTNNRNFNNPKSNEFDKKPPKNDRDTDSPDYDQYNVPYN